MKHLRGYCLTSLIVVLVILMSATALADKITTNGEFVDYYYSIEGDASPSGKLRIPEEQEASYVSGGWYSFNQWSQTVYVRASAVVSLSATPVPEVTAAPPTSPGTGTGTGTVTATPTPGIVNPVTDSTYEGTVISYSVPQGGLSLYNAKGGTVVEIAKQGTILKLTQITTQAEIIAAEEAGVALEVWYSLYYDGKNYYVPQSAMDSAPKTSDLATPSPSEVNAWRSSIRSVVLSKDTPLYTSYTVWYSEYGSGGKFPSVDSPLSGKTDNTLAAGSRVNVRYVGAYEVTGVATPYMIYSYSMNGKIFYFNSTYVRSGSESTASVVSNEDVALMSYIPIRGAEAGYEGAKLYITQNKSPNYYLITTAQKLYGVKLDADWYKVMYGPEVFYLHREDVANEADIEQLAANTIPGLGTYRVVAGSGGAVVYNSTKMGTTNGKYGPIDASSIKLAPGESVLASPYDSYWYTYTRTTGEKQTTYYIYRPDLADYVNTGTMSGYKVFFNLGTALYSKANVASKTSLSIPKSEYYTVQDYNTLWYSIIYDSVTYYILKEDVVNVSQSSFMITISNPITIYRNDEANTIDSLLKGQYAVTQATATIRTDGLNPADHYLFVRGSDQFFIRKIDVSGSGAISTSSFVITITADGVMEYPNQLSGGQRALPPGNYVVTEAQNENVRPQGADKSTFYARVDGGVEYLIRKSDVEANGSVPSDSFAVTVTVPIMMYENVAGGGSATLPTGDYIFTQATTNDFSPTSASNYYSYYAGGVEYLILKSDLTGNGYFSNLTDVIEKFAVTSTGKTYVVSIGMQGAILYSDSTCEVESGTLQPGETVNATKFTSSLYIVNNAGNKHYLPVRYIAIVKGGDDASVYAPSTDGNISDIAKGETDTTYKGTVLSYTVPAGGLWLHYSPSTSSDGKVLNAGNTVKLCAFPDENGNENTVWYTTWYGGSQYYVSKASLTVPESSMSSVTLYSITLKNEVTLYSNPSFTYNATSEAQYRTNIKLAAGTQINARVYLRNNTLTDKSVSVYSYTHFDGKTYYFPASGNVNTDSILAATLSSNTDTSLIIKFTLSGPVKLFAKPDPASQSMSISVSGQTDTGGNQVLYGINYNHTWYRVIYDNTAWYMLKPSKNEIPPYASEQLTVSSGATSTTYSVVIASGGVRLYTAPSTNYYEATINNKKYPTNTQNWYGYNPDAVNPTGKTLAGGSTVSASLYGNGWYTFAYYDKDSGEGKILYFQNIGAANSSSTSSIRSYQIILVHDETDLVNYPKITINLYNTIADNAPIVLTDSLTSRDVNDTNGGRVYTLRMLDSTWSSVIVRGKTYYVRNSSIPDRVMNSSTPIASTSVGNTYSITIGGKYFGDNTATINVYSSSTLTGTVIGKIALGTKTSGTLLYVEGARANTNNGQGLVYQINLNTVKGYIDASYVSGIASGDEASEAALAAQQAAASGVAVGTTVVETLNSGTLLYSSMSLSATTASLDNTTTVTLTKQDATWYSFPYSGATWYILATTVEKTSGTVTLSVGEWIDVTLTDAAQVYAEAEDYATPVDVMLIGETHRFTKISDKWYQVTIDGEKRFAKVADITLPKIAPTQPQINTNKTTDGVGIITPTVMISPASGTVNLRRNASASSSSTVLARIPKGSVVTNNRYDLDSNNQLWYNVTYNGLTGYVLGTYVVAVGTVGDSTVTLDPTQDVGKALTVNVSEVNIRSNAGTKYSVVGKLQKGSTIVPTDVVTGTDGLYWYKFNFSSTVIGYIRSDYLSGGSVSSDLTGNVAIKVGDTNLRSGAGSNFGVKTKLPKDTIVTIVGSGTDNDNTLWYRVTVNNLNGYVRADLVRPLTASESSGLLSSIVNQYKTLQSGDKGADVLALQQQLINTGYLAAGDADGSYGTKTTNAVKSFQASKGLTASGIANAATQAALFNTTVVSTGSTQALDWFSSGYSLINKNPNVQIYDINSGITWNAKYINGANHADVIPASAADAAKLTANNITGSYIRRPVIVTIAGSKFAGSMYAVGHGTTSYCSYFSGVMCIHFTGSKTHGSGNVDADHQAAINTALKYNNQ